MWNRVNNSSTFILSVFFLFGIYLYAINFSDFNLFSWIDKIGILNLLTASLFYFISHFIRGLRLAVMMGNSNTSLRTIFLTQYFTNGVNLILPFKVGELVRLYEFHKIVKKYKISFSMVFAEKVIDFFFLFINLLIVGFTFIQKSDYIKFTIILCGGIASLLLLLLLILPHNIKALNLFLAKRYSGKSVLAILSLTSKIYVIISVIKDLLREKLTTIILFTFFIWMFEVSAFYFVYPFLLSYKILALLAFLVFISDFIPSGSLGLGGVQLAFYLIYLVVPGFPFLELSFVYQIFVFFPAIVISCSIFFIERFLSKKKYKYDIANSRLSSGQYFMNFRLWANKMISLFKV